MKKTVTLLVFLFALASLALAQTPTIETFQPVFRQEVYILNEYPSAQPNLHLQPRIQVNPAYALDETSALQLLVVLQDYQPVLFHSGPFGWATSGAFHASALVPWIKFPNGAAVNAGQLAWYWSHGFSVAYLQYCIDWEMNWFQRLVDGGYPFDKVYGYPR